ncbi:MAG: hypothetical protein CVV39_06745, partial [Planctomycetes bacterium HGW-Planctomycetes-1]
MQYKPLALKWGTIAAKAQRHKENDIVKKIRAFVRLWRDLACRYAAWRVSCMLTSVMVNNSLIGKAGAGEASGASRASTSR